MDKVFVFDIGNVLWFYEKPIQVVLKKFSQLVNLNYKDFHSHYLSVYKQFETNTLNLEDWLNQINQSKKLITKPDTDKILKKYLSKKVINSYYNTPVLNLVKQLKTSGYKLGMLSNAEYFFIPYIHQRMLNLFDFSIVSGDIGIRKPDPKIYQHLINLSKTKPHQIIFIDDKKNNLDSAKALSINTLIYSDHQKFLKNINPLL